MKAFLLPFATLALSGCLCSSVMYPEDVFDIQTTFEPENRFLHISASLASSSYGIDRIDTKRKGNLLSIVVYAGPNFTGYRTGDISIDLVVPETVDTICFGDFSHHVFDVPSE